MHGEYDERFYGERHDRTLAGAKIIARILVELVHPASVVDLGCGVGTWLRAFQEEGVQDVLGVEGRWVEPGRLQIPKERFIAADLTMPLPLARRFDLALSLEVAEHLGPADADGFVAALTGLSDVVLFSAAIPFQEGRGHRNEQWPAYWAARFAARGYVAVDCLRPAIWTEEAIPYWYRQNAIVYARREALARFPLVERCALRSGAAPLALVHPLLFERKVRRLAKARRPWITRALSAAARSAATIWKGRRRRRR